MADYIRYDDSRALDERDRIDVVKAGAGVGGGLAVKIYEDNSTGNVYLDIEAEELWKAVHNGFVAIVQEEGGGGRSPKSGTKAAPGVIGNTEYVMLDAIVSASKETGENTVSYTFGTMNQKTYTASAETDKPKYGDVMH